MNVATSSSLGRPRLTLSFFYNPLSLHSFNTDGICVCLSYFVTRGWGTFLFAVSGVIFLVAQADEKPAQTENIRCTHARDLYVNDPNDVVQEFPTALCLNIGSSIGGTRRRREDYSVVSQVEYIKEEARRIAELPEGEFNTLVSQARDFSLARASDSMNNPRETLRSVSKKSLENVEKELKYIDEEEDNDSLKFLSRSSSHCIVSMPEDAEDFKDDRVDGDSGVCNSSKYTTRSTSDNEDGTDDSERAGVFNYFPDAHDKQRIHSRSSKTQLKSNRYIGTAHDEAFDADSEINSQNDSDSPRSDTCEQRPELIHLLGRKHEESSLGTELETFSVNCHQDQQNKATRRHNDLTYDEAVPADTDEDNLENVYVHERLYGSQSRSSYASMDAEDDEDYEASDPKTHFPLGSSSRSNHRHNYGSIDDSSYSVSSRSTNVDSRVDFHLGSYRESSPFANRTCRLTGSTDYRTSSGVRIEKSVKAKESSPPFGDPLNLQAFQLQCTEKLIDFRRNDRDKGGDREVHNLPRAAPISDNREDDLRASEGNGDGSKKKKKKKKSTKDDNNGDPDGTTAVKESCDINGNPLNDRGRLGKSTTKAFSPTENTKQDVSSSRRRQISSFPMMFSQLDGYEVNGVPMSEMDDAHSPPSSSTSTNELQAKQQRRRAKKEREEAKILKAENIPGNRGTEDVDSLLNFIENGTGKKKKKLLPPNGPQIGTEKLLKLKTKERKPRLNSGGKEERMGSENSSERGDEPTSSKLFDLSDEKVRDSVSECSAASGDLIKDFLSQSSSKTNSLPCATENNLSGALEDDCYIFTDLDNMPPVEEEFREVVNKNKKKKKPLQRDMLQKGQSLDLPREEVRYIRPIMRSVTPPPISTTKPEKPCERSLSPSAFPELGGRGMPREGRRRSLGDAQSEASPDDSDMESVKSLPLVAVKGNENFSPGGVRPLVSWAKIAALPKQSSSAGTTPLTNAPVTRERRHSIGTMSDAASRNKEDNSIKNMDKDQSICRSQELPVFGCLDSETTSCTKKDSQSSSPHLSLDEDFPNISQAQELTENRSVSKLQGTNDNPEPSEGKTISKVIDVEPPGGKIDNMTETKASSRPSSAKSVTAVPASKLAPVVRLSKSVTNNNNHKKQKVRSVVFLDKKLNESPSNLGISFGFEPSDIRDNTSAKPEERTVNSVNIGELTGPNDICVQGAHMQSKNKQEVLSDCPSTRERESLNALKSGTSQNNKAILMPPAKGKLETVSGLNGLIVPNSQGNKLSEDSAIIFAGPTPNIMMDAVIPHSHSGHNHVGPQCIIPPPGGGVVVTGGYCPPDGATVVSPNAPDNTEFPSLQHVQNVKAMSQEKCLDEVMSNTLGGVPGNPTPHVRNNKNNQQEHGNFNLEEAVRFLKGAWDSVIELHEKSPSKVVWYQE